jgi:hypothetical protein
MKVIIDIPEDDYKLACNHPDALITCYAHYIKAGVPLPKKHGRLIDADALLEDVRKNSVSYSADDFAHEWVDVQPTVIEAEDGD